MPVDSVNNVGRPTIIDENVVKILEEVLKAGSTVTQACYIAQISRQVFYNHIREGGEFLYRINTARNFLQVRALKNVANAIEEGDLKTSKWFLEKCLPIEAETRHRETNDVEIEIKPTEKEMNIDELEKNAKMMLDAVDAIKGRGKYAKLRQLGRGENRVIEGWEVEEILNQT